MHQPSNLIDQDSQLPYSSTILCGLPDPSGCGEISNTNFETPGDVTLPTSIREKTAPLQVWYEEVLGRDISQKNSLKGIYGYHWIPPARQAQFPLECERIEKIRCNMSTAGTREWLSPKMTSRNSSRLQWHRCNLICMALMHRQLHRLCSIASRQKGLPCI